MKHEIRNKTKHKVMLEAMDRLEGKDKHICDDTCKYWRFTHLERPCVLSSVFSVRRGEFCTEYSPKE
jgi:hypothetical protein